LNFPKSRPPEAFLEDSNIACSFATSLVAYAISLVIPKPEDDLLDVVINLSNAVYKS
jgi:hypothetical protein